MAVRHADSDARPVRLNLIDHVSRLAPVYHKVNPGMEWFPTLQGLASLRYFLRLPAGRKTDR